MKRGLWVFLFPFPLSLSLAQPLENMPLGIGELHVISQEQAGTLLSSKTRALISATEMESFLRELERAPPPWTELQDQPHEELGERLFAYNRRKDHSREGHALLSQKISFIWSGFLRKFISEHQGFTIAMGPEFTETAWGIVRFKTDGLPSEMIAIPPKKNLESIQQQLANGKKIEITILLSGHLIPNESIIYAFSHDDSHQGMIMPVVSLEHIAYFIRSDPNH